VRGSGREAQRVGRGARAVTPADAGRIRAAWLLGLLLPLAASPARDDRIERARNLRRQGQPAEAAALLEAALPGGATDGELVGLLGLCLLDAGELERARTLAAGPALQAGAHFRLSVFKARLLRQDEQLEQALEHYRAASQLNAEAVEAWVGQFEVAMALRKLGKALRAAEEVARRAPDVGHPLAAAVLRAQGDEYRRGAQTIELAADKYLAALAHTPDDQDLLEVVLETQILAVRLDAARSLVEERFGQLPAGTGAGTEAGTGAGPDYHFWNGRLLFAEQDVEAAAAAFRRARALQPEEPRHALWLARLELEAGRLDQARALLESCQSLGLQTAQTELLTGEVLDGLDDLQGAETHLRQAIALDASLVKAHYLLGRVLLRAGRREEGEAVLAHVEQMSQAPPVDIGDG